LDLEQSSKLKLTIGSWGSQSTPLILKTAVEKLEGSKVEKDQLQQQEVMVFEFARQILRLAVMQVELESSFVAVVHALVFQPSNLSNRFHPLLRNSG
jgi:hypothetical protein